MGLTNKSWMQLDCTDAGADLCDRLEAVASGGVAIWLKAFILLKNCNGKMKTNMLIQEFINRHLSINKVKSILETSGDFMVDHSGKYYVFTEQARVKMGLKNIDSGSNKEGGNQARIDQEIVASPGADFPLVEGSPRGKSPLVEGSPRGNSPLVEPSNAPARREERIENKEKEKRVKENVSQWLTLAPTPEIKSFYEKMLEQFPRICKMEQPLSWEQYNLLIRKGYTVEQVADILKAMENSKQLHQKYVSAYLTARKWLSR